MMTKKSKSADESESEIADRSAAGTQNPSEHKHSSSDKDLTSPLASLATFLH
jgi:hypothetical protein